MSEFKANCLGLLEDLDRQGGEIVVTKRGRPFASVKPARAKPFRSSYGSCKDLIRVKGEIVNFDTSGLWEALK